MGILRDNMVKSMTLNGYAPKTISTYTSCVSRLAYYYKRSPLLLTKKEISDFLYYQSQNCSSSTTRLYYESFKHFYSLNNKSDLVPYLRIKSKSVKLPSILSKSEIASILETCTSIRLKTIIAILYSSGLRISELINLDISDIDLSNKTILVRNGKGNNDRLTIISQKAIDLLKTYINIYKPIKAIFYSTKTKNFRISQSYVQRSFKTLLAKSNISTKAHVHTLRHSFATHLLDQQTNLFTIMKLLGHKNIQTTLIYLHLSNDFSNTVSPLDTLYPNYIEADTLNNLELSA